MNLDLQLKVVDIVHLSAEQSDFASPQLWQRIQLIDKKIDAFNTSGSP